MQNFVGDDWILGSFRVILKLMRMIRVWQLLLVALRMAVQAKPGSLGNFGWPECFFRGRSLGSNERTRRNRESIEDSGSRVLMELDHLLLAKSLQWLPPYLYIPSFGGLLLVQVAFSLIDL